MRKAVMGMVILAAAIACRPADSAADATSAASQPTTTAPAGAVESKPVGGAEDRLLRNRDSLDTGWTQTLLGLAAVVGLIFVARWLIKRGGLGRLTRPTGPLEVLVRTSLSSRQQLFLVRLGQRLVLLGSGPNGLATLSEVTDPAEVARLTEAVEQGRGGAFMDMLRKRSGELKGGAAGGSSQQTAPTPPGDESRQKLKDE